MISNSKILIKIFTLNFFLLSCVNKDGEKNKFPNVIYILADDLGYGDLNCYNNESKIKTPNIDRLALDGMMFTDMHSTSSVCTPTRYSILTGEYAWRTKMKSGVLWSYGPLMISNEKETVSKLFKKRNYNTAVIGKWHLGLDWQLKTPYKSSDVIKNDHGLVTDYNEKIIDFSQNPTRGPSNVGFDYNYIIPASLDIPPYVYLENGVFTTPVNDYTMGSNLERDKDGDFWRPGPMAEGFDFFDVLPKFIDKAKNYLTKAKNHDSPFFLYLPLAAPHTPWVPKENYDGVSGAGQYGEFVTMVDDNIGKLLDHLRNLNLEEDTIVVFASDNGPYWKQPYIDEFNHRAAGVLRGMKGDIYDGGHRIPFIVRWPGKIKSASTNNVPNTLASFYSTIADLLKLESTALDSHSIFNQLVEDTKIVTSQPIIHHSSEGHFAIRYRDWKMIEKLGSGGFSLPVTVELLPGLIEARLYNMRDDSTEKINLSIEHPKIISEMKKKLDSIRSISIN